MPSVRRLTAVVAADVAGYSWLMGADEEGTHERLKAHRHGLVDPNIAEHHGRIVKTTSDGMLAEFPDLMGCRTFQAPPISWRVQLDASDTDGL
jgi:class 3 adenylate cyclase